jgi:hypothetical protein
MRGELPEALAAQRSRAATICFDLAEYNNRLRKSDKVHDHGAEYINRQSKSDKVHDHGAEYNIRLSKSE